MDSTKLQALPRSIVQFLETKIADRERERSSKNPLKPVGHSAFARPIVNKLICGTTSSFLGLTAEVPLARCVVAGTRLPSARKVLGVVNDFHEHHPRSIINHEPSKTSLSSIPVHVADFLFDNYVTRVTPQYPIYYVPELTAMHNAVFHPADLDGSARAVSPYEMFTLNLIMAISLSTAARSKQARAYSIASGLFQNAMEQISSVLSNDLRGLQALTLLTQYTFLNPSVANFWLLAGFISQACIDLGLHHELPDHPSISPLERDMRRRVFWCAFEMETAVCGALLRPMTLLRKNITVQFSSQLEDTAITAAGLDPKGRSTKFTSHYIWRYRLVECDIVPVLFHHEPIPPTFRSLESWMAHQERMILEWKADIQDATAQNTDPSCQSQWDEMKLYSTIATDYILVTLFRPCPLIKEPTAENLLKAFSAAVGVADGSWEQANLEFGNSKYVFHSCYHSFSAAIAFLQALQRFKAEIAASYSLEQVESFMDIFSRFFATVAERWPAAAKCLEEYERLLVPVRTEFTNFVFQEAQRISEQSSSLSRLAASPAFDPSKDLEEAMNLGTFFNATGSGLEDTLSYYPYIPMDWNAEFNFDVNTAEPYE
ncbi:hypothetical protein PV08_10050 [Exophiala spinifera]|uniref:Xylanolytic transcriptional activator regulatory domain-containing protein n=1 Tax=Exophiala spinifera TaxID=91928 RepID=A0A0D1Y766_9EURO|nr:uncharacterized protein PV08_10050 [Exophiala spinifera]KIW10751.1 hypothetical protein PV08_10050 [Exophiala spinifera]